MMSLHRIRTRRGLWGQILQGVAPNPGIGYEKAPTALESVKSVHWEANPFLGFG